MEDLEFLATTEDKSTINKLREKYKEKMIDTNKSYELEKKIEEDTKKLKTKIKVAGTIATIALAICPADGPVGEIAAAISTPGLLALADLSCDIRKKSLIGAKRLVEKNVLQVDGTNEQISAYNLDNSDIIVKDINEFKNLYNIVESGLNK